MSLFPPKLVKSSITYTDERGGEQNFLVNETTFAIAKPKGVYDTLALDSATGQHTLTFRNGVKYTFEVVGYLKGKSAISVARQFSGRKRNFNGENFWARGYALSTVGFEESQIRAYIKNQEQLDSKGFDEKGNF
jgi:Transposase IS200 like